MNACSVPGVGVEAGRERLADEDGDARDRGGARQNVGIPERPADQGGGGCRLGPGPEPRAVHRPNRALPDAFEVDQAQAEMKDGVLTVTVPRVKVDLGEFTEIKVCKAE